MRYSTYEALRDDVVRDGFFQKFKFLLFSSDDFFIYKLLKFFPCHIYHFDLFNNERLK